MHLILGYCGVDIVRYKVFISHTNGPEDMKIVRDLASIFKSAGIIAYVAEDDRNPGNYLSEKIKANILSSDWIIGVWTQNASKSAYVNQEIGYVEDKRPCTLLVQKGVRVEGFSEGKEYTIFNPDNPIIGLNEIVTFCKERKQQKEIGRNIMILVITCMIAVFCIILFRHYSKKKIE